MTFENVEVTNRKPTWGELRLMFRFKDSHGQDYEAATELILLRTNVTEEALNEDDLLDVMALVQRVAKEVQAALALMKIDNDWDKSERRAESG